MTLPATLYRIAARNELFPVEVRHPGQFTLQEPTSVDAELVLGPKWSLYCLDMANEQALFVELPKGADLSKAPFVFGMQYQLAERAATVALDDLPGLAAQVRPPKHLAILMSTGRCGSTLASRILAQIPGVWSLSEPDWFTNLAFARADLQPDRLETLIAACARLTCRPPESVAADTIVIKPRSEMLVQAPSYVKALPGASAVFMYRDCFGYVNSLYRFAQRVQGVKDPAPGSQEWHVARVLSTINAPDAVLCEFFGEGEDIQVLDLMVLGWALRMRAYMEASSGGMRVAPLHYADLNADRRTQTALLLKGCGIGPEHLDLALQGFESDAHAGSAGENTVPAEPISPEQRARVAELVARWGLSDFVDERLPVLGD